jgi:hypothetical protein
MARAAAAAANEENTKRENKYGCLYKALSLFESEEWNNNKFALQLLWS